MSYCRWSTDDFSCDLYCYRSEAGYETYVACKRYVFDEPLPLPIDLSDIDAWIQRSLEVSAMVRKAGQVRIGLPHDGQCFTDTSLEDFLERLIALKATGYRFPDEVIDEVREEIKEPTVQSKGEG